MLHYKKQLTMKIKIIQINLAQMSHVVIMTQGN